MKSCHSNADAVKQAVREFMAQHRLQHFPTAKMLRTHRRGGLYKQILALGGTRACARSMGIKTALRGDIGRPAGETLCWSCKHAVPNPGKGHGCEWSTEFRPVPGWKAENKIVARVGDSYYVTGCPKYREG